ncbi:DUF5682 family protein [Streptomyces sp. NBC_00211]|uniref:DUF5682 family protein n=1 Tax=Streptomyces sp. NBC_00211 TaxID=2975683 RepID=UPI002F9163ED
MTAHFLGVRHHSPACARLVSRTIAALRPSHVLVEGPSDLNDRLGELLLGHRLPIAVFSHYRDDERSTTSWTPFCDYSPEWVALSEGRAAGAQVRFIDLPAWHPAFAGRSNRYADAEVRYERATARLCARFGVDSADALWDRMFEAAESDGPGEGGLGGDRPGGGGLGGDRLGGGGLGGDRLADGGLGGDLGGGGLGSDGPAGGLGSDGLGSDRLADGGLGGDLGGGGLGSDGPAGGLGSNALGSDRLADGGLGGDLGGGGLGSDGPAGGLGPNVLGGDRLGGDRPGSGGLGYRSLAERLALYFDVVRGDTEADASDRAREEYMASWVRAALAEPGAGPVLVVTGGFHRPALVALTEAAGRGADTGAAHGPPAVPRPATDALAGSHLVPYSFHQLDAFTGYQSGMPSPGFHQHVWEHGPAAAGELLVRDITERLRGRGRHVSTASLIAARAAAQGLAALRGHHRPARLDLLDGLAGALLDEAVDEPLPWTRRGPLRPGTHPVLVEMVAAGCGQRTGALHPDTPLPPIVHDVTARLAVLGLDGTRPVTLRLTEPAGLDASRVLHCLRILDVPCYARTRGPVDGADPEATERWEPHAASAAGAREAALIEASGHGMALADATATALGERVRAAAAAPDALARILFDAVACGATGMLGPLLTELRAAVDRAGDPGPLGEALHTALGLWRHDRVYGVAGDPLLAGFVDAAVARVLWLAEGLHGAGGVDRGRVGALTAVRDAVLHAAPLLSLDRAAVTAVCARITTDPAAPADLRGAAYGLCRALAHRPGEDGPRVGGVGDPVAAVRAVAGTAALGDWLAGVFALAREELTAPAAGNTTCGAAGQDDGLLGVLDALVSEQPEDEFLAGLPALRQAFAYFPPRERERIAARLIERRGLRGSARGLLRTPADPLLIGRARRLEDDVSRLLERHGLGAAP